VQKFKAFFQKKKLTTPKKMGPKRGGQERGQQGNAGGFIVGWRGGAVCPWSFNANKNCGEKSKEI